MKEALVLVLAIWSSSATAAPVFHCEASVAGTRVYLSVMEEQGIVSSALDFGRGETVLTTRKEVLPRAEFGQSWYVRELVARKAVKVDLRAVNSVTIYEAGNYSDDAAGAVGVVYHDVAGAVLAKGMFMGWAGPLGCTN